MLEIKITTIEMKTAFHELINRLDTVEERITELEEILTEIFQAEMHREKQI